MSSHPPPPDPSHTNTNDTPTPPSPNNPNKHRINKALGTTFDDASSREALDIAAGFYVEGDGPVASGSGTGVRTGSGREDGEKGRYGDIGVVPTKGMGAGIDGDMEKAEEEEVLFAPRRTLKGVDRATTARKYLKRDVESQLAETSRRFLDAFGDVDKVCLPTTLVSSSGMTVRARCSRHTAPIAAQGHLGRGGHGGAVTAAQLHIASDIVAAYIRVFVHDQS